MASSPTSQSPDLQVDWIAETNPNIEVPIKSKPWHRFYEPVVFLRALTEACPHHQPESEDDDDDVLPLEREKTPLRAFHRYLDRLAQVCDSSRGGATVTAIAAVATPSHVHYRFGSNQRKPLELERTRNYITEILQMLGRTNIAQLDSIRPELMRRVLTFTEPRITVYMRTLYTKSLECLSLYQNSSSSTGVGRLDQWTTALNPRNADQFTQSLSDSYRSESGKAGRHDETYRRPYSRR